MIDARIKIDLGKLKAMPQEVLQIGAEGLSKWAELMREHASADHYQGAHSIGRYENTAGKSKIKKKGRRPGGWGLSHEIKQMPVVVRYREAKTGIIAMKDYAGYVETGTSRSKPYPYMVPAMEDEKVQEEGIKQVENSVKRKFGG